MNLTSLAEIIEKARQNWAGKVDRAIEDIICIANELAMKDIGSRLVELRKCLASDNFHVIIVGRARNGKSKLVNAILGQPTHPVPVLGKGQGPMPSFILPSSAVLTNIRYSEKPYVKVWYFDGKYDEWSMERYWRESTVQYDVEETFQLFNNIHMFEVGYPSKTCKAGITLMDSPGYWDVPYHEEVTRQAVMICDAAIMVYRYDVLAGIDERDFASEILSRGTRLFTIINLVNNRQLDERIKAFVWNRLVKDQKDGPKYDGQDFTSQDIYFINALKAERGRLTSDENLVNESGLLLFEKALGNFLIKERYRLHLEKFVLAADRYVADMADRCAAIMEKQSAAFNEAQNRISAQRRILQRDPGKHANRRLFRGGRLHPKAFYQQ